MPSDLSAEEYLRGYQTYFRQLLGFGPKWSQEEVLALALQKAQKREEQAVRRGEFIYEGGFRYPARLEELRWEQTRDVIRRVAPGMDEDPVYLEMLARQAPVAGLAFDKRLETNKSSEGDYDGHS